MTTPATSRQAPRFAEGDVPEQFRAKAQEGDAVRATLADQAPQGLDWVFISPAGGYGARAAGHPGTATPR